MYKLLIVEKEPGEILSDKESFSFGNNGFVLAGEAHSSKEGLLLAEELAPDLVIADIDMPYMDGLLMADAIMQENPATRFIFMTQEENAGHLQPLIKLGAIAYLKKPVEKRQMDGALKDARLKLDAEYFRLQNATDLKEYYYAAIPLLKEMLFRSLLSGNIHPDEAVKVAETYGIDLHANRYAVALIRPENTNAHPKERLSPEALEVAVMNVVQKALDQSVKAYISRFDGQLAAVFMLPRQGPEMLEKVTKALAIARNNVRRYLEADVCIGLSSPRGTLDQLPFILNQAAAALDQCRLYGNNKVLAIVDIEPGSRETAPDDSIRLQRLVTAIKTSDDARIRKELTGMFRMMQETQPAIKAYRSFLMEIIVALSSIIRDMDLKDEHFDQVVRELMLTPSPEEAQMLLERLLPEVAEEITAKRTRSARRIASDAVDYLREHYHEEDLKIESLSQALYVSSSYLSSVFKKETGKTFLKYLTDLRMSSAMSLLAQDEMTAGDAGKAVGFADASYFSQVFKKYFGLSPSEVKRQQRENT